jgi:hypothetical protein
MSDSVECEVRSAECGLRREARQSHSALRTPNSELAPRRVVLLGASNLTRGISTIVETAAAYWGRGRPLELFAALGHGRSYGGHSSVLGRRLPGILQSGLWQALASRPPAPTAALITDIGNDLLFEVPPGLIADWVRDCLQPLRAASAKVVMTMLPLGNHRGLSEWRFVFLRTCFFPSCSLSLEELLRRAAVLDQHLRNICAEYGVAMVEQRRDWYGIDPIHIKLTHWRPAWGEILAPWCDAPPPPVPPPRRRRWLQLRLMAPEQRWFFGISQRRPQPAGKLEDGSQVFLY